MAQLLLHSNADPTKKAWITIDDPVRDSDGYLQLFGIQIPSWSSNAGYHNLHLVRHDYPLGDTAVAIWDSSTRLTSSRSLLKYIEECAREEKWYDIERFPSFKEHAGKLGLIIGSATLLHKYLKTRPFRKPGYYNAKGTLILPQPIRVDDEWYRP